MLGHGSEEREGALLRRLKDAGQGSRPGKFGFSTGEAGAKRRDVVVVARVERWLPGNVGRVTVVVLDPPRRGAGRQVCAAIVMCEPRVVVYVACDPASLARDVATLHDGGYEVTSLRAFDLFPMTAHVECVAVLERRQ